MSRGGRGRGASFGGGVRLNATADLLGLRRDELPAAVAEPPPLFPPVDPPLPLEIDLDLVAEKQEFRSTMQMSEYYIKETDSLRIHRYTDKYRSTLKNLELGKAVEQLLLPAELRTRKRVRPGGLGRGSAAKINVVEKLKELEEKYGDQDAKVKEEPEDEAEAEDEDDAEARRAAEERRREKELDGVGLESDGEDMGEEANDYEMNYFDNGEDYLLGDELGGGGGGMGGDEDDGPVY